VSAPNSIALAFSIICFGVLKPGIGMVTLLFAQIHARDPCTRVRPLLVRISRTAFSFSKTSGAGLPFLKISSVQEWPAPLTSSEVRTES